MSTLALAALALALAVPAIILTFRRPLIFPFGLYVALVPFDSILGATGASITRGVAVVVIAALTLHILTSRRLLAPPRSWAAWTAVVLWAAVTAFWSIDQTRTSLVLGQLLLLLLFFTVTAVYPVKRADLRMLAAIIVGSGALTALYGIYLYMTGTRYLGRMTITNQTGGTLDPNHIAAALLLPMALALGTAIQSRNLLLRCGAIIALLLMMDALLLTGSRGGLISFIIMLLYIAWKTRYRVQIFAIGGISGVASLIFAPTMWTRFSDPSQGAGSGRLFIWDLAARALGKYWLKGAGIGGFPEAYNQAFLSVFQPVFQGWSRPAHNVVLGTAVELGVFGAAALLYAWWQSWRDARGNVVLEAAIIGLFVASMFLDTLAFKYLWLAFSMAALAKNAAEPRYLRGMTRQDRANAPRIATARLSTR